jgi:hypothetical protein
VQAVGSDFAVADPSGKTGTFWLRLIEVRDLPIAVPVNPASMAVPPARTLTPVPQTTGFLLSFAGGPAATLQQATYLFQHDNLGQFELFIVPGDPQQYSAVFNWLGAGVASPFQKM